LGEYQARNRRDNTHQLKTNGRAYETPEKQEHENAGRRCGAQLIFTPEYPAPQVGTSISEGIIQLMSFILRKSDRHHHAREY
jgi:hypothetical protein